MSDENSGLDELMENVVGGTIENHPYRTFPYNEFEDTAWEWFEEFNHKFPVDIECDFIAVSTRMENYNARAYYRDSGKYQFIRFSSVYIETADRWELRRTLLHEMVHLYTYQQGHHDVSDSSVIFKWLCGAVGAEVNQIHNESPEWIDLAEPFIEI